MIAVAVVEVPVEHQHAGLLQVLQRLLAQSPHVCPSATSNPSNPQILKIPSFRIHDTPFGPPTIVAATPPRSCQPSNGVFLDFRSHRCRRHGDRQIGRQDRDVGRRALRQRAARHDAESAPGSTDSSSISRDSEITPGCTRRSKQSETAVSSPVMPNGAWSNSTCFSS